MSLSALISGSDCGPINPLQGLSKQLDRNRGAQQDHFASSSRAGPSRQAFRSSQVEPQSTPLAQEASQFFSRQTGVPPVPAAAPSPFDLSSLNRVLPSDPAASNSPQRFVPHSAHTSAAPAWALDFKANRSAVSSLRNATPTNQSTWKTEFGPIEHAGPSAKEPTQVLRPASALMSPPQMGMGIQPQSMGPSFIHHLPITSPPPQQQNAEPDWAAHFSSVEEVLPAPIHAPPQAQTETAPSPSTVEADDLAAVAGLLVDSIKHETNPKFKESQFMGLMHRLRERDVVVDGNDMVQKDTGASYVSGDGSSGMMSSIPSSTTQPVSDFAATEAKDKGRAAGPDIVNIEPRPVLYPFGVSSSQHYRPMNEYDTANPVGEYYRMAMDLDQRRQQHVSLDSATASTRSSSQASSSAQEYEEMESPTILGKDYLLRDQYTSGAHVMDEWGKLQASWDELDATATGLQYAGDVQVSEAPGSYAFQTGNPYLQSGIHTGQRLPYQSVLQTEAAVQRNPQSAEHWFQLGVRQQENEREDKAIQSLRQAIQINPKHLSSWLALAVSLTNESDHDATFDAIQHWVDVNDRYAEAVGAWRTLNKESIGHVESSKERQKGLLECLMAMARMAPNGQIDPDVQIALGVLLNTSEEYSKAQDCFQAALTVRPDDWLLYNRVGATLANSGSPAEAVAFYLRALELNPSYIRARFNLGISFVNLKMFDEAARNIMDALVLQEQDASPEGSGSGLPNSTLWDSLRTACIHLQQSNLVALCERKDLNGFREAFALMRSAQTST